MGWEVFRLIAEESQKRYRYSTDAPSDIKQQLKYTKISSNIIRCLFSLMCLWIISSGTIIRIEGYPLLNLIGLIANGIMILIASATLFSIWRYPLLAAKALLNQNLLLLPAAIIIFLQFINVHKNYRLSTESLIAFNLVILMALGYLVFSWIVKKYIEETDLLTELVLEYQELGEQLDEGEELNLLINRGDVC